LVVERFGLIEVHAKTEHGKPAEIKVMAPAAKESESLIKADVIRCDYPNTRVMLVKLEDGKQVFCNVFDSRPFKPRMPIVVKHRGGRYFCEHRPTSILRLNTLIKRNSLQ
jgi:hypothetical protein